MINSYFIVRYTNGLYSTPAEFAPRYDEFRDMFSSGQIASKEWAVKELDKLGIITVQHVLIAGCWFGTLGLMLKDKFPGITLSMLDIDPRCKFYLDKVTHGMSNVYTETGDMYTYRYTEDMVVNTACEHIKDVGGWLSKIRKGTLVLLQSNDFVSSPDHINCVNSVEEFVDQAGLDKVLYSGKLVTPMYTRFMIIGIK